MSYDEYPMPRPMLLVKEPDSWLIDPLVIPFALGVAPYTPLPSIGQSYHRPQPDREARPAETAQVRRPRRFRAFLKSLPLIRP